MANFNLQMSSWLSDVKEDQISSDMLLEISSRIMTHCDATANSERSCNLVSVSAFDPNVICSVDHKRKQRDDDGEEMLNEIKKKKQKMASDLMPRDQNIIELINLSETDDDSEDADGYEMQLVEEENDEFWAERLESILNQPAPEADNVKHLMASTIKEKTFFVASSSSTGVVLHSSAKVASKRKFSSDKKSSKMNSKKTKLLSSSTDDDYANISSTQMSKQQQQRKFNHFEITAHNWKSLGAADLKRAETDAADAAASTKYCILDKIVDYLKSIHLKRSEFPQPLTLFDLLAATGQSNIELSTKKWLSDEALPNNAKINVVTQDNNSNVKYLFEPVYPELRDKKGLKKLLKKNRKNGVLLVDVKESLPKCDKILEKMKNRILVVEDKNKIMLYIKEQKAADEVPSSPSAVTQITSSPSFIKRGEMTQYQIAGLNWLISLEKKGMNGILADEMGLGKTLQTISMLGYMKNCLNINGPFLIITSKSTIGNWESELRKWCPSLEVFSLSGNDLEGKVFDMSNKNRQRRWDVCVSTYHTVKSLKVINKLKTIDWHYLVIDEAQNIKSEKTKLSTAVRSLKSKNRLLLTGSPINNKYSEFWTLLNFIEPEKFDNPQLFNINKERSRAAADGKNGSLQFDEEALREELKPYILRRKKSDVATDLLPKLIEIIEVDATKQERKTYDDYLTHHIESESSLLKWNSSITAITAMRKLVSHPHLDDHENFSVKQLIKSCGKLKSLKNLLKELKRKGSRVLIFCQFKGMLDILVRFCRNKDYKFCRLDGDTKDRVEQIDKFNAVNSNKFVFLMSTKAGGVGINLTSADTVILYDSDWNPQADQQAMDRAHRIGQKKQVRVYRFVTKDTIEEFIVKKAEEKLELVRLLPTDSKSSTEDGDDSADHMAPPVSIATDLLQRELNRHRINMRVSQQNMNKNRSEPLSSSDDASSSLMMNKREDNKQTIIDSDVDVDAGADFVVHRPSASIKKKSIRAPVVSSSLSPTEGQKQQRNKSSSSKGNKRRPLAKLDKGINNARLMMLKRQLTLQNSNSSNNDS